MKPSKSSPLESATTPKEELQERLDSQLMYHTNVVEDLMTVQEFINEGDLKKAKEWLNDLK